MSKLVKYKNILVLSLGIFLTYSAFNSSQNLQSLVMQEDGFGQMGYHILATLYLFMGLGSIFSTAIINKFGSRKCMMMGGLGNAQWIFTTILATEHENKLNQQIIDEPPILITVLIFVSTIINGFTVGILWSCANNYVARNSDPDHKGTGFGIFWTFYMMSQISGNLIASYTLEKLNQTSFFLIMGSVALVGTSSFYLISNPSETTHKMAEQPQQELEFERQVRERRFSELTESTNSSQIIRDPKDEQSNFKSDVKLVLHLIIDNRMRYVMLQICWTGISIAVYTGLLVPTIVETLKTSNEQEQFKQSMLAMVALGVGEISGAVIQGKLVDKYGTKNVCVLNMVLILVATIFVLNYLYLDDYSVFAFIMTFVWGFQDSAVSIHLNTILSSEFDDNPGPFSLDSLIEATMVFCFQMIQSFVVSWSAHFIYISFVGIAGILMCATTLLFEFRNDKIKGAKQNHQNEGIALTRMMKLELKVQKLHEEES
ncbi:major facilitator superfamily protein [Stylonychia lemnae]|uniref:Major facilitator superfamily protein n=1 Tax=Stylonychia lemnae TaxID=5949 RepID=A0A078B5Y5_STYLE|nr:major facilitator superfamily protein [Stylonychia lemnae]|eukprot:CDW89920.1 major facilitator superfamily protein [Stylonychia lemnae]